MSVRVTYICDGCSKEIAEGDVFACRAPGGWWKLPLWDDGQSIRNATVHICSRKCGERATEEAAAEGLKKKLADFNAAFPPTVHHHGE